VSDAALLALSTSAEDLAASGSVNELIQLRAHRAGPGFSLPVAIHSSRGL